MNNARSDRLRFAVVWTLLASAAHAELSGIDSASFSSSRLEVAAGSKALAFSDVNQDGHQDLLLAASADGNIAVFLGDGNGNLRDTRRFQAGRNPSYVTAADIDADGDIDLVVANHETDYITLLTGDGRGGFVQSDNSPLEIAAEPHPHVVLVPDIDGDGDLDLIVDHRSGRGLLLIESVGQGDFDTRKAVIDMGGDPYLGLAIGDVNEDGRLDLVTPNENEIGVALNTSAEDVTFSLVQPVAANSPFAVALADLDADGSLDLLVASDGSSTNFSVFKGDGDGGFETLGSPVHVARGAKNIATGDLNGDGVEDALITSWSSDARVLLGGSLPFETFRIPLGDIENPWGVAISDLNEDGIDDFVISDGVRPIAGVYLSNRTGK